MTDFADAFFQEVKQKIVESKEIGVYVKQLDCLTLHKLARLLEVSGRSTLRKSQLSDKITKRLKLPDAQTIDWSNETTPSKHGPLLLICDNNCEDGSPTVWMKIFSNQIKARYAEQYVIYKKVYARSEFNKCDTKTSITFINKNDDVYYFLINSLVKVIVLPTASVVFEKDIEGEKKKMVAAVQQVSDVMSAVWNTALNWLTDDDDAKGNKRNPHDILLDSTNSELQIEFKETATPAAPPIVLTLVVLPHHDISYVISRLRRNTNLKSTSLFLEQGLYLQETLRKTFPNISVDEDLNVALTGFTMRFRGTFSRVVGDGNELPERWSEPVADLMAIGYDAPQIIGEVTVTGTQSKPHLQFSILNDGGFEYNAKILPGIFTGNGKVETTRRTQINASAITLGMEWFDSDEITVNSSFILPKPISAALHSRPLFGSGENDCPAGYDRENPDACCTYILKNVLETTDVTKLESCLATGGDCKSMDAEDLKQMKLYIQGEKRATDALNQFITSLGLTPKQLEWMMQTATSVKEKWVALLGKALNRLYDDAGITTDADLCNEQTEGLVDASDATLDAKGIKRGSWSWLKWVAQGVGLVIWGIGQTLRLIWLGISWLAQKAGMVFSAVMPLGQRIATWILNDPSKARFILVLVRRVKITMCQRFGSYLITNGYIDLTNLNDEEARKLQIKLVELAGTIQAEVGEDESENGTLSELLSSPSWFASLQAVSGRISETATAAITATSGVVEDLSSLSAGGIATITQKVFSGDAVQNMLAKSGTVLKKALVAQVKELPFVGAFVGEVVDFIADEVGGQCNEAVKETLLINKMSADITNAVELFGDIFNVNACLLDAGFHPSVQINLETIQYVIATVFAETRLGRAVTTVVSPVAQGFWWVVGRDSTVEDVKKAMAIKINAIWTQYYRDRAKRVAGLEEEQKLKAPKLTLQEYANRKETEEKSEEKIRDKINKLVAAQDKRNKEGNGNVLWPGIVETPEEEKFRLQKFQKQEAKLNQLATEAEARRLRK